MIRNRKMVAAAVALVAGLVATGVSACGPTQLNDLRNAPSSYPDYAVTYLNVDNFPNFTLICVKGVGFVTTTRDLNAVQQVPEWNAFCATKEKGTTPGNLYPTPNGKAPLTTQLTQTSP